MQIDLGIIKMTVNSGGRYIVHTSYYLLLRVFNFMIIKLNIKTVIKMETIMRCQSNVLKWQMSILKWILFHTYIKLYDYELLKGFCVLTIGAKMKKKVEKPSEKVAYSPLRI